MVHYRIIGLNRKHIDKFIGGDRISHKNMDLIQECDTLAVLLNFQSPTSKSVDEPNTVYCKTVQYCTLVL